MTKKQEKTTKTTKTTKPENNKSLLIILGVIGVLGLFAIISIIVNSQSELSGDMNETSQVSTEVVATVNGEEVYEEEVLAIQREFSQTQENMSYDDALDQAVMITVLRQELKNSNESLSLEQTQSILAEQLQAQGISLEEYRSQVNSQGQSFENLLQNYQFQFSIQQFLEQQVGEVNVTEQEIEEFYLVYSQQAEAQGQQVPKLEQIREQLVQNIKQQKASELRNQYVSSLVEEANVEYS